LVVVAIVVGVFLMNKGGGGSVAPPASDRLAPTTTTSTAPTAATPSTVASATLPPASVKVIAANGTTVKGLAAKTKATLAGAGFTNVAALSTTTPVPSSIVYFVAGADADAKAVAKAAGFSEARVAPLPAQVPVSPITGARVIVLLGPDAPGAATPGTPTTLAAQATTTTVKK
jgi:hypothetical protein